MLIIRSPKTYVTERDYIYKVIFQEFLGIEYSVDYDNRQDIEIRLKGSDSAKLNVADVLFQTPESNWLKPKSLPARPLARCEYARFGTMPVLFGKPNAEG